MGSCISSRPSAKSQVPPLVPHPEEQRSAESDHRALTQAQIDSSHRNDAATAASIPPPPHCSNSRDEISTQSSSLGTDGDDTATGRATHVHAHRHHMHHHRLSTASGGHHVASTTPSASLASSTSLQQRLTSFTAASLTQCASRRPAACSSLHPMAHPNHTTPASSSLMSSMTTHVSVPSAAYSVTAPDDVLPVHTTTTTASTGYPDNPFTQRMIAGDSELSHLGKGARRSAKESEEDEHDERDDGEQHPPHSHQQTRNFPPSLARRRDLDDAHPLPYSSRGTSSNISPSSLQLADFDVAGVVLGRNMHLEDVMDEDDEESASSDDDDNRRPNENNKLNSNNNSSSGRRSPTGSTASNRSRSCSLVSFTPTVLVLADVVNPGGLGTSNAEKCQKNAGNDSPLLQQQQQSVSLSSASVSNALPPHPMTGGVPPTLFESLHLSSSVDATSVRLRDLGIDASTPHAMQVARPSSRRQQNQNRHLVLLRVSDDDGEPPKDDSGGCVW